MAKFTIEKVGQETSMTHVLHDHAVNIRGFQDIAQHIKRTVRGSGAEYLRDVDYVYAVTTQSTTEEAHD
jgi:hypothetical protein